MKGLSITLLSLLAVSAASDVRTSCNQCPYRTANQIDGHWRCAAGSPRSAPVQFRDGRGCYKFFECNRGTAYEFVCAEGLAYSLEKRICENGTRVDCAYDGRSSAQDTKSPTFSGGAVSQSSGDQGASGSGRQDGRRSCNICSQATESIPRHQNCPRSNGYYPVYFRHSKDCSQFYQCDHGTAYLIQCPAGLHFNTRINVCDYPQNVDCSGPVMAPTTSSPGSPGDGPASPSCSICQNAINVIPKHPRCPRANGYYPTYFRHETDCSIFYQCDAGSAYEIVCPAGLHFNTNLNVCDYPEKAGCAGSNGGTISPSNDNQGPGGGGGSCNICSQATESIPRHQNCPRSNGYYPVYFRHSNDCSQFYQCDHGTAYLIQCPAGLHFNTRINVCDYPQNVDCSGPVMAPTTSSPGSPGDGPASPSCSICQNAINVIPKHPRCPRANGYYPTYFRHETDCSIFYQCDDGSAYEIVCPAGLHFNTNLNVCDYPEKAGCSGHVLPPSAVSTSTPAPAIEHGVHPQCPTITGHQTANYWAHHTDCRKYFGCLWGCVELFSCPSGYRWHDAKKACVEERLVKC